VPSGSSGLGQFWLIAFGNLPGLHPDLPGNASADERIGLGVHGRKGEIGSVAGTEPHFVPSGQSFSVIGSRWLAGGLPRGKSVRPIEPGTGHRPTKGLEGAFLVI